MNTPVLLANGQAYTIQGSYVPAQEVCISRTWSVIDSVERLCHFHIGQFFQFSVIIQFSFITLVQLVLVSLSHLIRSMSQYSTTKSDYIEYI